MITSMGISYVDRIITREESKLILPGENFQNVPNIGHFVKKKSSEPKDGQYTGRSGADKSNITNSQKMKAHETFL